MVDSPDPRDVMWMVKTQCERVEAYTSTYTYAYSQTHGAKWQPEVVC